MVKLEDIKKKIYTTRSLRRDPDQMVNDMQERIRVQNSMQQYGSNGYQPKMLPEPEIQKNTAEIKKEMIIPDEKRIKKLASVLKTGGVTVDEFRDTLNNKDKIVYIGNKERCGYCRKMHEEIDLMRKEDFHKLPITDQQIADILSNKYDKLPFMKKRKINKSDFVRINMNEYEKIPMDQRDMTFRKILPNEKMSGIFNDEILVGEEMYKIDFFDINDEDPKKQAIAKGALILGEDSNGKPLGIPFTSMGNCNLNTLLNKNTDDKTRMKCFDVGKPPERHLKRKIKSLNDIK